MTTSPPAWDMGHRTNTPACSLSYFLPGRLPFPGRLGRAWPLSPPREQSHLLQSLLGTGLRWGSKAPGLGYFIQGQLSRGQPHIPPDPSSHRMTQQPTHPTPIQAQRHLLLP